MAGKMFSRLIPRVYKLNCNSTRLSSYFSLFFEDCAQVEIMSSQSSEPKRNVEIKAFLGNDEDFQSAVTIARNLTSTEGELIKQRDVFFKTLEGRLKLRYLQGLYHQLILYARSDQSGPKLSTYRCVEIQDAEGLEHVLCVSNGIRGIVEKDRLLFIYENTRIHLDKVKDLGNYLEFEVMLKPEDKVEHGQEFAEKLMNIFNIKKENLIHGAYLDLLIEKGKKWE